MILNFRLGNLSKPAEKYVLSSLLELMVLFLFSPKMALIIGLVLRHKKT